MKKRFFLILLSIGFILPGFAVNHIRWGSNGNPLSGLTVTWSNNGTTDSISWGYTQNFEKGKFAGVSRNGYAGNFFKYVFPQVTPSAKIYYKLYDSNTKTWGTFKIFSTAPVGDTTNFSFCVLGDSRTGLSVWKEVSDLANVQNSAFTLYNGDIVEDGGSASAWNAWFDNGSAYLENNIVYHALGNHDAMSVPTYQNIFDLPKANNTNLYYSFTYGNTIFITLNSENPGDAAQTTWLKNTLAAAGDNPNITWKVVSFHRPFYTVGTHAGEMNAYFNTWWKAFDDYGVDLIVNGHDHMYERSKPINRNVSTTAPVSTYGSKPGQGRCQIVCGGAGAPLYSGSPTWAIEKFKSTYNFCKFAVNGTNLCGTVYDNKGNIIDSFCIDKKADVTGVEEGQSTAEVFHEISVYPNPTTDKFSLRYSSPVQGDATVKIFDLQGRQVLSETVHKNSDNLQFSYDLSGKAKGVYTVQVVMGEQKDNALLILE